MKRPDNIHDALDSLHTLLNSVTRGLTVFMTDERMQYDLDYFEDMKAATLDAHLLVTWVKDNFKEMQK